MTGKSTDSKSPKTRVISWDFNDTPIPKVGMKLSTMHDENYVVVKKEKDKDGWNIHLLPVPKKGVLLKGDPGKGR